MIGQLRRAETARLRADFAEDGCAVEVLKLAAFKTDAAHTLWRLGQGGFRGENGRKRRVVFELAVSRGSAP